MEREKNYILSEIMQRNKQLAQQLQLAEGIMSQVEQYARSNPKSLSVISDLHRIFAETVKNAEAPIGIQGKNMETIFHHAFNDLLYFFNDNHEQNSDPSGFIHKGNACRLLVLSSDFAMVKKRAAYRNMKELMDDLSHDLPQAANYPAFYYDASEIPHLMVQRVGIAQVNSRLNDFDFTFCGIQQTMRWGNAGTKYTFHVVQEEKQGERVFKPAEINPYIFAKHYPGKPSIYLP